MAQSRVGGVPTGCEAVAGGGAFGYHKVWRGGGEGEGGAGRGILFYSFFIISVVHVVIVIMLSLMFSLYMLKVHR